MGHSQPRSLLRVWLGRIAALRLEVPLIVGCSDADYRTPVTSYSPFNPLFRAFAFRKSLTGFAISEKLASYLRLGCT